VLFLGAAEQGLIYGLMALGVYLSFRILSFPDLSVDGTFPLGAAVAGILILRGVNPFLAALAGGGAGLLAGAFTGVLATRLRPWPPRGRSHHDHALLPQPADYGPSKPFPFG